MDSPNRPSRTTRWRRRKKAKLQSCDCLYHSQEHCHMDDGGETSHDDSENPTDTLEDVGPSQCNTVSESSDEYGGESGANKNDSSSCYHSEMDQNDLETGCDVDNNPNEESNLHEGGRAEKDISVDEDSSTEEDVSADEDVSTDEDVGAHEDVSTDEDNGSEEEGTNRRPNNEHHSDDPDDPGYPNELSDGDLTAESESSSGTENFSFGDVNMDNVLEFVRNCTAKEALCIILALAVRHNWSYESITGVTKFVNVMLGMKVLPHSKKMLWRTIKKSPGISLHGYCSRCKAYLGKKKSLAERFECRCTQQIHRKSMKTFVMLNMKKQFEQFLKTPGVADLLQYQTRRQKRHEDSAEDIMDGNVHKSLIASGVLSSPWDFTYVFNTDGFQLTKSGKRNAWPLFIRLNGLPPNVRQKHMFLVGLWVGEEDPTMSTFLYPFVKQANKLSSEGIFWNPNGEHVVRSKFFPVCCSCDSKARYSILNMTQYNGYYGCTFCDHKGMPAGRSMKYPIESHPEVPNPIHMRTHDSIISDMREAHATGAVQKGVKGPCELINLQNFDLATGFVLEFHTLYLGVGKFNTQLLFNSPGKDYYVTAEMKKLVNSRLMAIKTPKEIARKPRSTAFMNQWKGTEWRNWVIYYMLPCLQNLGLPQQYINHLGLFSEAVFLLSSECVSGQDIVKARDLLDKYVRLFEQYYEVSNMRYNVHLLTHLTVSVQNHGPLWSYCTLGFESWNNKLLNCVKSPKGVADQIITRYLMNKFVSQSLHDPTVSVHVRDEIESIMFKSKLKDTRHIGDVYTLGQGINRHPTAEEIQFLEEEGFNWEMVAEYKRVISNYVEYHSYVDAQGRSDNRHIFTWNAEFCTVQTILVLDNPEVCLFFVYKHNVQKLRSANHIVKLAVNNGSIKIIPASAIRAPAIQLSVAGEQYMVPLMNRWQID